MKNEIAFEQQHGESAKAFAAFSEYLAMGPQRSLSLVAQKLGKTKRQMEKWSQRFGWAARVEAHAAHLAVIERNATEELVLARSHDWAAMHEAVRREAWAQAEDLIALAEDLKSRWRDSDRLPDLGALLRALDLAFKLKQFAAGMPSEIKQVNTTTKTTIDMDWEVAIRKAYGRPEVSAGSAQPALLDVQASEGPETPGMNRETSTGR